MRRSYIPLFAAVSLSALVGLSTSPMAMTGPKMNLGLLKSQDGWKVGTVDAQGSGYCAMVGKFDKQVVLAFARNPDGFGSVAMDFRERFFTPGEEYEVRLKAQGTKTRSLVGRASTDRSIVVQIGQDEAFYNALGGNSPLEISMPTIDVSFALKRFNNAYQDLISCSGQIIKDQPRQKEAALSPIDRELQQIDGAEKTAAVNSVKAGGFDAMEQELEKEAQAEQVKARETLKALDEEKEKIASALEAEKQKAARAQAAVEALGRQALHAYLLAIEPPASGEILEFRSELPGDLSRLRDALKADSRPAAKEKS